jgi:hypothetical protein
MTINQCLKTGANVLLTDESIVVHGDLFFTMSEVGYTLVLHYVLPHKAVIVHPGCPVGFDAVFDTHEMYKNDAVVRTSFLDLGPAKVMVMGPDFSWLSKEISARLNAEIDLVGIDQTEDALFAMLKAKGVKVTFIDVGGDENGN